MFYIICMLSLQKLVYFIYIFRHFNSNAKLSSEIFDLHLDFIDYS